MTNSYNKYLQILTQAGLKGDQAIVYEALLKSGPKKASSLGNFVPFKRSLTYKILTELVEMGLVVKKEEPRKVAVFEAAHPFKIKEWVEKRQEQFKNAEVALSGFLPKLVSDFNMVLGMPGIQIFEGLEGAKKVLADSLSVKGEIYSYVDSEAVNKNYPEINREYVGKRVGAGISKKMILQDSEFVRKHIKTFNSKTTQARVILVKQPFSSVMQIYGTKVSYITLQGKNIVSVIIDNPNISQMHKTLFEVMWQNAKPIT